MKIRIKFSKQGEMRFIGHLDFMRFFQKVIRRAGIGICYSEGMSPHMQISFASPLGIGLTGSGEYVDVELSDWSGKDPLLSALNAASVPDVRFIDAAPVKAGKAMALVAAASYEVRFRGACPFADGWEDRLPLFLSQEEIMVSRENKKGVLKEVNIRPMIFEMQAVDGTIRMLLASGSTANLRPERAMECFGAFLGTPCTFARLKIDRTELYALSDDGSGNRPKFIPLIRA